jgi:hypothetical protein
MILRGDRGVGTGRCGDAGRDDRSSEQFIGTVTMQALSNRNVYTSQWNALNRPQAFIEKKNSK